MTPQAAQNLIDRGVVTIDSAGVVRLTNSAMASMTMYRPLHFVGFKDDRYWSAVKVWGKPDFYHRFYDHRAVGDIAPGDRVVFACPEELREFSFDDSANW